MIVRNIPNFCLQHDQTLGMLRLEWVWIPLGDPRQLRASAQQLLILLATLEVRHLLLDMNSVPNLPLADQLWLGDHWMPGLVALDLEQLAVVISGAQLHNQLTIDARHNLVKPAIRFAAHYFSDNISAMNWLTNGSPQLPVLLAEWEARCAG